MKLVHRHDSLLLSSDWHVLHRNIYWFVPKARALISEAENVQKLDDEIFLQAERRTYEKIFAQIQAEVEKGGVEEFIFLGDLVFGLDKRRGLSEKLETIAEEIPAFAAMFGHLEEKGIQRTLILGNHDDYKLKNKAALAFYNVHFDEMVHHLERNGLLLTHFPLGYSLAQEKTHGTPEEKFFRMSKTFKKIDQELLQKYGEQEVTNFHGHIHQGGFVHALPNVTYRNMAIDVLAVAE